MIFSSCYSWHKLWWGVQAYAAQVCHPGSVSIQALVRSWKILCLNKASSTNCYDCGMGFIAMIPDWTMRIARSFQMFWSVSSLPMDNRIWKPTSQCLGGVCGWLQLWFDAFGLQIAAHWLPIWFACPYLIIFVYIFVSVWMGRGWKCGK